MSEYQVQIVPKLITPRSQYESFHKDFIAVARDSHCTFSSSFDVTGEITEPGMYYCFTSTSDARDFKTRMLHAFPNTINEILVVEMEKENHQYSSRRIIL